jgi:hypothetical protein
MVHILSTCMLGLFAVIAISYVAASFGQTYNEQPISTRITASPKWQIHQIQQYGFEIAIPPGWVLEGPYVSPTVVSFTFSNDKYSYDDLERELASDHVRLTVARYSKYTPPFSLGEPVPDCPPASGAVVQEKDFNIGGIVTSLVTTDPRYQGWPSKPPPVGDRACVEHRGYLYTFFASGGDDDTWLQRKPLTEQVMRTFRFL